MISDIRDKVRAGLFEFSRHAVDLTIQIILTGRMVSEQGNMKMADHDAHSETMTERTVTYTLQKDDTFLIVENVPARVCLETGEELFAPETVERLQQTIWSRRTPVRILETPVFDYAAG